jgi:hypothetical protein
MPLMCPDRPSRPRGRRLARPVRRQRASSRRSSGSPLRVGHRARQCLVARAVGEHLVPYRHYLWQVEGEPAQPPVIHPPELSLEPLPERHHGGRRHPRQHLAKGGVHSAHTARATAPPGHQRARRTARRGSPAARAPRPSAGRPGTRHAPRMHAGTGSIAPSPAHQSVLPSSQARLFPHCPRLTDATRVRQVIQRPLLPREVSRLVSPAATATMTSSGPAGVRRRWYGWPAGSGVCHRQRDLTGGPVCMLRRRQRRPSPALNRWIVLGGRVRVPRRRKVSGCALRALLAGPFCRCSRAHGRSAAGTAQPSVAVGVWSSVIRQSPGSHVSSSLDGGRPGPRTTTWVIGPVALGRHDCGVKSRRPGEIATTPFCQRDDRRC